MAGFFNDIFSISHTYSRVLNLISKNKALLFSLVSLCYVAHEVYSKNAMLNTQPYNEPSDWKVFVNGQDQNGVPHCYEMNTIGDQPQNHFAVLRQMIQHIFDNTSYAACNPKNLQMLLPAVNFNLLKDCLDYGVLKEMLFSSSECVTSDSFYLGL